MGKVAIRGYGVDKDRDDEVAVPEMGEGGGSGAGGDIGDEEGTVDDEE